MRPLWTRSFSKARFLENRGSSHLPGRLPTGASAALQSSDERTDSTGRELRGPCIFIGLFRSPVALCGRPTEELDGPKTVGLAIAALT